MPAALASILAAAGAILGLAAFNSIYLDARLHPLIYRFLVQRSVSVSPEDLQTMHPTLSGTAMGPRSAWRRFGSAQVRAHEFLTKRA